MKYLITESQRNNTVDKYITYALGKLTKAKVSLHSDAEVWIDEDNQIILNTLLGSLYYVSTEKFDDIKDFFSLTEKEVQDAMELWLEKHLGLRNVIVLKNSQLGTLKLI
jgi:hypothetical protein